MQNDKLLPCPFCGGEELDLCNCASKRGDTWLWSVECIECGIFVDDEDKDKVIKHWNTRKPMERIVEQLEERKEDIAGYIDDDIFLGEYRAYRSAIDIVKGGVDNG